MVPIDLLPRVEGVSPRCQRKGEYFPHAFCGRPAVAFRPARDMAGDAYYCIHHAGADDVILPAEPLVRAVTLHVEVTLVGVSSSPAPAQNEAVCRLDEAVKALGGVVDVRGVTSGMVRIGAPRRVETANASQG